MLWESPRKYPDLWVALASAVSSQLKLEWKDILGNFHMGVMQLKLPPPGQVPKKMEVIPKSRNGRAAAHVRHFPETLLLIRLPAAPTLCLWRFNL